MDAPTEPRPSPGVPLAEQVQALRRVALAAVQPGGDGLFADLAHEIADTLGVAVVLVAVYADDERSMMRTLAAHLDGRTLSNFDYPLAGSPCARVQGREFRYVARGVSPEFAPGTLFAAKGMDSYAAFPMVDSDGQPLGLLVAMDREPVAGGDAAHAEAILNIAAGRLAAELERARIDDALRAAALAVSGARGETVFEELVRLLATILRVEVAFIARHRDDDPECLTILAMVHDSEIARDLRYALAGTPCETVLGRSFHAYPQGVQQLFPDDPDVRRLRTVGYAGYPLAALDGTPIGIVSIASRRPLTQLERVESMLKIFAVRAAAELERLQAGEALARSEASYRAIFESAEDAIFVHDWDSGRFLDVNPKACEAYGYGHDELCRLSVADISSDVPPYTAEDAARWIELAKQGRCPPFEWHRRTKDGSLHWDEVRLKPALIGGKPHVLAFARDITGRKNALAALQKQEQKYRAIFDGSVDAMVLWSQDLRVVDVNDAFVHLTGITREQVFGRHWSERPDLDDMRRLVPVIQGALAGREERAVERVSRADGSLFDIELRYLPVRLGGVPYALGVGRDVSAQLEHERELVRHAARLRDSEAQYRAIFNASADALVLRDANFAIVDVNATYESMSGFRRDEVLGVNRVLANPPEVMAEIRALHDRALAGEAIALDTQLVRRDAQRYELELRGVPIRHRGEPHVLYIGRDITQAKRAERALRDSEEQYRAIFNASADALVLRDADYHAVEVNPAYTTMSGFSREEVMAADHVLTQVDDEVRQRHRVQHELALAGQELSFEVSATRKDGSQMLADVRGMPMMYRGRRHVLYATRDITERRAAEQRRVELERQLRQAQKMEAIGQLTGGIAHDFNNILTSVIGYVVLASERAEATGDATIVRQLGQSQMAAQRARELIQQMLTFARRRPGERRVIDLGAAVPQALQLLRATLPASIAVDYAPLRDGDGADGPRVSADPVQLEQVLFNLCINARDAIAGAGLIKVRLAQDGGGWQCASCRARAGPGRWVELSVADSGSGITPSVLERMFEPFFSTKAPGQGSGMGLAMVHGIVHDHDGHLRVDSRPGAGSVFRVMLPAVDDDATRVEPVPASEPVSPSSAMQGSVLVVEDDVMAGNFLVERLTAWGLDAALQRDAAAAAAWLEEPAHQLDLLLTDHTMPTITGLQLAERAHRCRPELPIVLVSGRATTLDAREARRCGVRMVLAKPLDAARLHSVLQELLPQMGPAARSGRAPA